MGLKLEIINPLQYHGWDELLLSHEGYSFFHSSYWAKVLCESYKYIPLYFAVISSNRLQALIPFMEINSIVTGKRGVALPFSDYCKIIISENIDFTETMNYLIDYGKKAGWKFMEIRDESIFPANLPPTSQYYGHILKLSQDTDHIFSGFGENNRRNIKKAMKDGVRVNILNSLESIKEFYHLNCVTRKKHGLPPQPYNFFKNIYKHIISKNHGFVALASYNNTTIAGAIYFYFGDKAIYKYGASDQRFQHLRANNLIMWEAIQRFSKNGYKILCFGRTDPDNEGLRRFKKGWGTAESLIKYYKYDMAKKAFVHKSNQFTEIQRKIFSNMPQFLLKTTGSILYRHIG